MTDELLPYYRRELAYIRDLANEFAAAHPKIAARLQLGPSSSKDPHVERIVEAFAYLTARIRHKLDDDFPEIAEALLGIVFPQYLRPIPSAAIVQFLLDRQQVDLVKGHEIPCGAMVETESVDGEPCRFRTCYPVQLWPIRLTGAHFKGQPFTAPATSFSQAARAVVRIEMQCWGSQMRFSQLPLDSLRFYLQGPTQFTYDLYETLLNHTIGIALADSDTGRQLVMLPNDALRPVGLERHDTLEPDSPRSFWGYRLLSDYFAFPEKFLFIDVAGLTPQRLSAFGQRMIIFVYLNRYVRDLEQYVTGDTFSLGCTPIVNLFPHRAEPIQLTHAQPEYRVVPSERRPLAYEIYSIGRVIATSSDGEETEYQPFYSVKHSAEQSPHAYWHASRRRVDYAAGQVDYGTEVHLQLVDLDFQPASVSDSILDVETVCLNRDLPHRLPFGGGQPYLQLSHDALVTNVRCLTAPTRTLRPATRHETLWRLVSHLSLNYLSLVDNQTGADALREILKLYDFNDSADTRRMIDGILSVSSQRCVGRVGGSVSGGFCRGLEVTVHLDEEKYTGGSAFLFASILERFLGLYCSLNSFTRLVATTNKREAPLHRWPPRASDRILL